MHAQGQSLSLATHCFKNLLSTFLKQTVWCFDLHETHIKNQNGNNLNIGSDTSLIAKGKLQAAAQPTTTTRCRN